MNQCQSYCRLIKRMCNSKTPLLPEEYQQVEYLQSSGTQYIRSGIYNCDTIDAEFQVTSMGSNSGIICARSSSSGEADRIGIGELLWRGSQLFTFLYDGGTGSIAEDTEKHHIQMGAGFDWKVYFDGVYQTDFPSQKITPYEVYLFRNILSNGFAKCKIFYAKLYAQGALVRHFVPCYRKSDNKPGMYDLVSRTFFTNAGTGEFIVGNNV